MTVFNRTRNTAVADRVERADGFFSRLTGLLGRRSLGTGEGLWIAPCAMVHTWFMAFPIDAIFLGHDGRVLRIIPALKPWRFSPWVLGARSALELPAGGASGKVFPGDVLDFTDGKLGA